MGANSALQSAHTALTALRSVTADITFLDLVKESTPEAHQPTSAPPRPSLPPQHAAFAARDTPPHLPEKPLFSAVLGSSFSQEPPLPLPTAPTVPRQTSRTSQLLLSGRSLEANLIPSVREALGDLQLPSRDILIRFDTPSSVSIALSALPTRKGIRMMHLNLSLSTPLRSHAVVMHRVPTVVDKPSLTAVVQTISGTPVVRAQALPSLPHVIVAGDFNAQHQAWDPSFSGSPSIPAKELAGFFRRELPSFLLPPSTITFPSSSSCIDLILSTPLTADLVLRCSVEPAFDSDSERRNLKKLEVEKLRSAYSARSITLPSPLSLPTVEEIEKETNQLTSDILHSISLVAPLSRSSSRRSLFHPASILLHLWPLLSSRLTSLYTACIRLGHHPSLWRQYLGIVLRKPGKANYSVPKAYRLIALEEMLSKVLEGAAEELLRWQAEKAGALPPLQFTGRRGRGCADAVVWFQEMVKGLWRGKKVVVACSLDGKGVFPNTQPTPLVNTLLDRFPPSFLPLLPWLNSFLRDRQVRLVLKGELSAVLHGNCGLPQGSPLSPLVYCLLAAPLLDLFRSSSSTALGYVDDVLALGWGRNLNEAVAALQTKLRQAEGWAEKVGAAFEPSKSGWMVLSMAKAVREEGWGEGRTAVVEKGEGFGEVEEDEQDLSPVWYGAPGGIGIQRSFDSVQRSAAQFISGALRSTSLPALEVSSFLHPTPLRLQRNAFRYLTHARSVPSHHPLSSFVRSSERKPQTHPSPLTRLSSLFLSLVSLPSETIDPLLVAEPGTSNLNTPSVSIPPTKEAAVEAHEAVLAASGDSSVVLYSDGSLLEGRAGAAVAWWMGDYEGKGVFPARGTSMGQFQTVYAAELVGIRLALDVLDRLAPFFPPNEPLHAYLFLDNQSAASNFCSTDASPGQSLRLENLTRYRTLKRKHPHLHLNLHWVPGHVGVEGNEAADLAAKEAAFAAVEGEEGGQHAVDVPVDMLSGATFPESRSALRAYFDLDLPERWNASWRSPGTFGAPLRRVDHHAPSKHILRLHERLPRRLSSLLTQLRDGHSHLKADRYRSRVSPTDRCECGAPETLSHFLLSCPLYRRQRAVLAQQVGPQFRDVARLMSDPLVVPFVLEYCMATERFSRSPAGPSTLSLEDGATLADLQAAVLEKTGIPTTRQDLRLGFPPKPLDPTASPSDSLSSLGIKSGETIVVAEGTGETATASTSSSSPSTSSAAGPSSVPQKRAVSPSSVPSTSAPSLRKPTPPQPVSAPPKPFSASNSPSFIEVDGGFLVLRVVPDDNSCLFRAVGLALSPGDKDAAAGLRRVVAGAIQADPEQYSEATLGRSPSSYIETILKPSAWGGAIELAIFASHFQSEIWSIDVQSGRVDRFGEGQAFDNFVLLVYSGIHYDALTFSFAPPEPSSVFPPPNLDFDTTVLSKSTQDHLLTAAQKLVSKLRAEHAYTDTATFTLSCGDCKKALTGEKEAREHAKQMGHTNFQEYDG
ncbi:hypothetical protein JCM8547_004502 [Rhodosporidiobolus lusitaniae]